MPAKAQIFGSYTVSKLVSIGGSYIGMARASLVGTLGYKELVTSRYSEFHNNYNSSSQR